MSIGSRSDLPGWETIVKSPILYVVVKLCVPIHVPVVSDLDGRRGRHG